MLNALDEREREREPSRSCDGIMIVEWKLRRLLFELAMHSAERANEVKDYCAAENAKRKDTTERMCARSERQRD